MFASATCCQRMVKEYRRQGMLKEAYIAFLCHETVAGRGFVVQCPKCLKQVQKQSHTAYERSCNIQAQSSQVLVFCGTKSGCARTARLVAKLLHRHGSVRNIPAVVKRRRSLLQQWEKMSGAPLEPDLKSALEAGFAWHNSSLTLEERGLVEKGYRDGIINVLFATSTLAVGVNLPASRVVFDDIRVGYGQILDRTRYFQMAGRAGRTGQRNVAKGESYIVMDNEASTLQQVPSLFERVSRPYLSAIQFEDAIGERGRHTELPSVNKKTNGMGIHATTLARIVLEAVATKLANSVRGLRRFFASVLAQS